MKKIPLKEAIEAQTWFECHGKRYNEELEFRLRIAAFVPFHQEGIDTSALTEIGDDGVLWVMKIEFVNLCKTPLEGWKARDSIKLIDEDGFQFDTFTSGGSKRLDLTGDLHRFSGWSNNPPLSPKIKATGAIVFLLPDQESNYYLTVKDGTIREA